MSDDIRPAAAVILAAGEGTRMNSELPKALHQIGGAPMLDHVIATAESLMPSRLVLVTGHGAEAVEEAALSYNEAVAIARQEERRGTGHAMRCALPALDGFKGDVFVLYADTPLIAPETLERMREARDAGAACVVLGFRAASPGGYGRLIVEGGALMRITEAKEASPEELAVDFCNSGVMCLDGAALPGLLAKLSDRNAKGEFYLTDVIAHAREAGMACVAVECEEAETLGVNDRRDLAAAEAAFQARRRAEALENGVTLLAPETVFFAHDTWIGRDAVIEQNVVFGPGVTVETGARIRAFSHVEGAHVSAGAIVGPYARLRPGTEIGNDAHVGNFVELKNTVLGEGAKANHLSYLGDAEIGAKANIGAGTITCNYDGYLKHRTEIGEGAFIGSNAALVAPVRVGRGALVAAGSTITADVADDALALARGRQQSLPGRAATLRKLLAAKKAARKD